MWEVQGSRGGPGSSTLPMSLIQLLACMNKHMLETPRTQQELLKAQEVALLSEWLLSFTRGILITEH